MGCQRMRDGTAKPPVTVIYSKDLLTRAGQIQVRARGALLTLGTATNSSVLASTRARQEP